MRTKKAEPGFPNYLPIPENTVCYKSNEISNQGNIGWSGEAVTNVDSTPTFLSSDIETKLGRKNINKKKGVV